MQYLCDAFPDNPADPEAEGVATLKVSLHRALSSRQTDQMAFQKYNIPIPRAPAVGQPRPEADFDAELYAWARQLQQLNEELRQAHARERRIAIALQEAMLHSRDRAQHPNIAVRYLPADRLTVTVGDVVGHGLPTASVTFTSESRRPAAGEPRQSLCPAWHPGVSQNQRNDSTGPMCRADRRRGAPACSQPLAAGRRRPGPVGEGRVESALGADPVRRAGQIEVAAAGPS
ncbi:hypothetical protein ACWC2T_42420 [Streptomyces sp. NPDC001393]